MALTDSLVAYYKLDSGALTTDSVGSFTLTNTNSVGEGTAKLGTASADFGTANTNKRLQISNDLGTDGASITMSFWVKMNTEIGSGIQSFIQHGGATSFVNDWVGYDYNAGTRRLGWNRQKQNVSNNTFYYNVTLGTTNWHHIVYTYDGTTMKGYYNGAEVVSQALSGNGISVATDSFTIGQDLGQVYNGYASAYIDEVGVWTRAITGNEVLNLFRNGAGNSLGFLSPTNSLTNFNTPSVRASSGVSVTERTM